MKKCIIAVVVLLSVTHAMAFPTLKKDPVYREARRNGAQAKIELHVAEDDGTPVADAKIKAYLGMNFRPKGTWVNGTTDTNGVFVLEGKTCGDEIEVFVTKDGYYKSHVEYCYAMMGEEHDVKDGKWQPYGAEEKIVLRPIKNPLEAMRCSNERRYRFTERICEWIGFDIAENDFVAPFGKGETSDFEVFLDWDGKRLDCERIGFKVRFTQPYSGYYEVPIEGESELTTPYSVMPNMSYSQTAEFCDKRDGKRIGDNFDKSKCWVVRSRCRMDAKGELTANYTVVRFLGISGSSEGKAGFCFMGAFNPTPNDTNLEPMSDAVRNALK